MMPDELLSSSDSEDVPVLSRVAIAEALPPSPVEQAIPEEPSVLFVPALAPTPTPGPSPEEVDNARSSVCIALEDFGRLAAALQYVSHHRLGKDTDLAVASVCLGQLKDVILSAVKVPLPTTFATARLSVSW